MTASRFGGGLAVVGAAVIAAATLFPTPGAPPVPQACIICGQLGGVDAVLNVLLFVPFGTGLGLRRMRFVAVIVFIISMTAFVELLQLTVIEGRSATLGDLLANTLGGALGYLVGMQWRHILFPTPTIRRILVSVAALMVSTVLVVTGYSLQPAPTGGTYFGQYARRHRDEPPFPGTVRSAAIAGCAIPNWTLVDHRCVHSALTRGDTFKVDVVARGTSRRPTAIVRVADDRQNEIAMLGADRDRAIFTVRTRAAAMHFRPYHLALDSVFDPAGTGDVRLAGTFVPSRGTILATGAAKSRRIEIRLGPASGWRMLTPFRFYDNGSLVMPTIGAVWLAVLFLPVGYWSAKAARSAKVESVILVVALSGALVVSPAVFRTSVPSAVEVLASIAGACAGIWARRMVQGVVFDSPQS
jgi:hypothetical protein